MADDVCQRLQAVKDRLNSFREMLKSPISSSSRNTDLRPSKYQPSPDRYHSKQPSYKNRSKNDSHKHSTKYQNHKSVSLYPTKNSKFDRYPSDSYSDSSEDSDDYERYLKPSKQISTKHQSRHHRSKYDDSSNSSNDELLSRILKKKPGPQLKESKTNHQKSLFKHNLYPSKSSKKKQFSDSSDDSDSDFHDTRKAKKETKGKFDLNKLLKELNISSSSSSDDFGFFDSKKSKKKGHKHHNSFSDSSSSEDFLKHFNLPSKQKMETNWRKSHYTSTSSDSFDDSSSSSEPYIFSKKSKTKSRHKYISSTDSSDLSDSDDSFSSSDSDVIIPSTKKHGGSTSHNKKQKLKTDIVISSDSDLSSDMSDDSSDEIMIEKPKSKHKKSKSKVPKHKKSSKVVVDSSEDDVSSEDEESSDEIPHKKPTKKPKKSEVKPIDSSEESSSMNLDDSEKRKPAKTSKQPKQKVTDSSEEDTEGSIDLSDDDKIISTQKSDDSSKRHVIIKADPPKQSQIEASKPIDETNERAKLLMQIDNSSSSSDINLDDYKVDLGSDDELILPKPATKSEIKPQELNKQSNDDNSFNILSATTSGSERKKPTSEPLLTASDDNIKQDEVQPKTEKKSSFNFENISDNLIDTDSDSPGASNSVNQAPEQKDLMQIEEEESDESSFKQPANPKKSFMSVSGSDVDINELHLSNNSDDEIKISVDLQLNETPNLPPKKETFDIDDQNDSMNFADESRIEEEDAKETPPKQDVLEEMKKQLDISDDDGSDVDDDFLNKFKDQNDKIDINKLLQGSDNDDSDDDEIVLPTPNEAIKVEQNEQVKPQQKDESDSEIIEIENETHVEQQKDESGSEIDETHVEQLQQQQNDESNSDDVEIENVSQVPPKIDIDDDDDDSDVGDIDAYLAKFNLKAGDDDLDDDDDDDDPEDIKKLMAQYGADLDE